MTTHSIHGVVVKEQDSYPKDLVFELLERLYEVGYSDGHDDGHSEGYDEGYNDGAAEAELA